VSINRSDTPVAHFFKSRFLPCSPNSTSSSTSPVAWREAGFAYMLTGSMALTHYAQPRMTRDIDIVPALGLDDLERLP
jgi:hypothetical protein